MRAVIQRVENASVKVRNKELSSIDKGMLVFLGVAKEDSETDADYILEKAVNLRIFEDEDNKMNLSLLDIGGAMMIVSQFTLLGNCVKGRRPSFVDAEEPQKAKRLYEYFVSKAKEKVNHIGIGQFQEMMKIELINDGPVTMLLDSKKIF